MKKILASGCLGIMLLVIVPGLLLSIVALPAILVGVIMESPDYAQGGGNPVLGTLQGVPQSNSWPGPFPNGRFNSEYNTASESSQWSPRSCGAASVTAVLRAYGLTNKDDSLIRIADVLDVAIPMGAIANSGWQGSGYFEQVLDKFGDFRTEDVSGNLELMIQKANEGYPVISSVKDSQIFEGGHILVVAGGNEHSVLIADSSGWLVGDTPEIKTVDRALFQRFWSQNRSLGLVVYAVGIDPKSITIGQNLGIPQVSNTEYKVRVGPVLAKVNPTLANSIDKVMSVSEKELLDMVKIIAQEERLPPPLIVRQVFRESRFNPYVDGPGPHSDPNVGLAQISSTWAQMYAKTAVKNPITDVEPAVRALCKGMRKFYDQQMKFVENKQAQALERALAIKSWGPGHFPVDMVTVTPLDKDWLRCNYNVGNACAPENVKKYIGWILYNDENRFMP